MTGTTDHIGTDIRFRGVVVVVVVVKRYSFILSLL